jgi:hypothetical protein
VDGPIHITVGDGDLEDDLLPRNRVTLPCDVTELRFGDLEDFGPSGRLFLRFSTSPRCLDEFLAQHRLEPVRPDVFASGQVPAAYAWQVSPTAAAYAARNGPTSMRVRVDQTGARPGVYVIVEYE